MEEEKIRAEEERRAQIFERMMNHRSKKEEINKMN